MTSRDQALLALVAVIAIVALLGAGAVAAFAVVRTQREHRRIARLEAQVQTLCSRRNVTGLTVTRTGHFTVKTARGC